MLCLAPITPDHANYLSCCRNLESIPTGSRIPLQVRPELAALGGQTKKASKKKKKKEPAVGADGKPEEKPDTFAILKCACVPVRVGRGVHGSLGLAWGWAESAVDGRAKGPLPAASRPFDPALDPARPHPCLSRFLNMLCGGGPTSKPRRSSSKIRDIALMVGLTGTDLV